MARRLYWWALFATITTAPAACNALNGAHDRTLEDTDSGAVRVRESGADTSDDEIDTREGGADRDGDGSTTIDIEVSKAFTSVNGGTATTTAAGTSITGYDAATHPVIVPMPQPTIPSEDYTVYATVKAPNDGEFGIVVRIQPGASGGYVLGSKFGGEPKPFLGSFTAPDWNPSRDSVSSTAWIFVPNARFNFVVRAVGTQISGKMWDATLPEPNFQVIHDAPWATGKAIGFYTYFTNGAILESMHVTVP